jgi:peptide methionine sulfoxide reductase MsrA
MKKSRFFRFFSLCLISILLLPSLLSCSRPPEYAEIEPRLKELVEASYEVNAIFFGAGLETYERVYDPKSSTKVLDIPNGDGEARKVWYYYTSDEENKIIAYRDSYLKAFSYALQSKDALDKDALMAKFPATEGYSAEDYYAEIYADTTQGIYCYSIPYEEKHYDLYYTSADPEGYDYVVFDSEYDSISSIKAAAEKVYSREYLADIYEMLFEGASIENITSGVVVMSPRYIEHSDDLGTVYLMKSNTYEPLIGEKRVFDFSTAQIVRKSNRNFVTIEIESYLESKPEERLTVKLTMTKQNGEWLLDSATY